MLPRTATVHQKGRQGRDATSNVPLCLPAAATRLIYRNRLPLELFYFALLLKRFIKGQWEMTDRANLQEIILHVNSDLLVFKRP